MHSPLPQRVIFDRLAVFEAGPLSLRRYRFAASPAPDEKGQQRKSSQFLQQLASFRCLLWRTLVALEPRHPHGRAHVPRHCPTSSKVSSGSIAAETRCPREVGFTPLNDRVADVARLQFQDQNETLALQRQQMLPASHAAI